MYDSITFMYYFAYSSNMNLEHMRRLCGWNFTVLGPSVLQDYEFGPDLRGYFNIRKKSGSRVNGVLYEVNQSCIDILDEVEGYPEVFGRVEVSVYDSMGKKFPAWVYLQDASKFGGQNIKENFLKMVMAGAISNHLPQSWLKFLDSFKK